MTTVKPSRHDRRQVRRAARASNGCAFQPTQSLIAGATAPAARPLAPGSVSRAGAGTRRCRSGFEYPPNRETLNAARAKALKSLLIEKGIITDKTVDSVLSFFETQMGPFNGAKVVARAWVDPAFKQRLGEDTPAAIATLDLPKGMAGAEGEHMRAAVNSPTVHNLVICTLCSCYPWPVLGLPPYWYKDPTFRSRAAREPRVVLKEFGLDIPQLGRDQDLGQQRADPLVRGARAAGRHGRHERSRSRQAGDAGGHDGGRQGVSARVRRLQRELGIRKRDRIMQTNFEQFAVTSMLGHEDSPPRLAGKLCFARGVGADRRSGSRLRCRNPDISTGRIFASN